MDKLLEVAGGKVVEWLTANEIGEVEALANIAAAYHSRGHAIQVPDDYASLMEL